MKTTPLQSSFANGEISPRAWMRADTRGYREGTRVMENFVAKKRGQAQSRDGFRYLGGITPFPGTSVIVKTAKLTITAPLVSVTSA